MLPFAFDSFECTDDGIAIYNNCTFTKSFGPIEEGDDFDQVAIDLEEGSMKCWRGDADPEEIYLELTVKNE